MVTFVDVVNKQVVMPLSRYEELQRAEEKLIKLEVAGVDNWEGYEEAIHNPMFD